MLGCEERARKDERAGKPKLAEDGSDLSKPGILAPVAAGVIMKVMYGARMARFDLLPPVQVLARYMTRWTRKQDEELHRLMCYIHSTDHWNGRVDWR